MFSSPRTRSPFLSGIRRAMPPQGHHIVCSFLTVLLVAACGGKKDGPTSTVLVPTGRSTIVAISNAGYVEARTSQIVTNGALPSTVFDDFSLTATTTIRSVGWQGIYCVQRANAAAPAPTATAFTLRMYTDVSGRPNVAAPVFSATFPMSQVGQTFDKTVTGLTCGTAANTTWPFYRYSVTLPTTFTAAANTKYWISVQATTASYDVFWGWRDGTVDNNLSLQLFNGTYTPFTIDRAYSLVP